jgi:hypothetical protein
MRTAIKYTLALSAVVLLVACGGGGGGGEVAPTTPVDYQLRTGYVNYVTSTGSSNFTVSGTYTTGGTSYPITGSGTTTLGSLSATTFEGLPAQMKAGTVTGSISVNGTSQSLNGTQYSYVNSNYDPLGNSGTEYVVVTTRNAIPVTARVNDTNIFYTANRYTTSQKTSQLGTRSVSFVIEPYSGSNAYLTIISTDKNNSGTTTATNSAKFIMTPAGALTRVNETGVSNSTNPTAVTSLIINY